MKKKFHLQNHLKHVLLQFQFSQIKRSNLNVNDCKSDTMYISVNSISRYALSPGAHFCLVTIEAVDIYTLLTCNDFMSPFQVTRKVKHTLLHC